MGVWLDGFSEVLDFSGGGVSAAGYLIDQSAGADLLDGHLVFC